MVSMGRRKKKRRFVLIITVVLIILIFGFAVRMIDRALRPTLMVMAQNQVQSLAINLLTDVIEEEAIDPFHYSDLMEVQTTPEGYVSYMMPNTMRISRLVSRISSRTQDQLDVMDKKTLAIPAGQLSGIAIFANLGPEIPVQVLPVGAIDVQVDEDFQGVGINHAKHTIYLEIECQMQIAVPLIKEEQQVSVRMPVAEAIIVGPVPEMYLSMGGLSSFLEGG